MKIKFTFFFVGYAFFSISNLIAQSDITITIADVKKDKGTIYFMLFAQEDGFPVEMDKAKTVGNVTVSGSSATYTFKNVEAGKYAISAFLDENGNKEVETNFIGIPKEKVGVVNHKKMGKPSFEKCSFTVVDGEHQELALKFIN